MSTQLLIVFDLDGTLIKSNIDYEGIRIELRKVLKNFVSKKEYKEISSQYRSILELVGFIEKNDPTEKIFSDAWSFIEEQEKKGYEKAILEDDVHPTLEKLRELNHIVVILTNNSRILTDYGLKKYDLNKYFDFVLTRDDVEQTKPDPEGMITLMKQFNKNKNETIFIGDSWLDAETAVNAGVKFYYLGDEGAPGTRKRIVPSTGFIEEIANILDVI